MVATSVANSSGFRSGTRQIPVPSFSVVVTADARPRATNGSTMSAYTFGILPSAEPGQGVPELTGSIECSGTHKEANPNSSARLATTATSTE